MTPQHPHSELYAQETRLRLEALEKDFESHVAAQERRWDQQVTIIDELRRDVEHAKQGRPTWLVTITITTLASLCTALIVALVK